MSTEKTPQRGPLSPNRLSTKQRGDAAESQALAFLQAQGLRLIRRNFHTPGRGGGEIDLIMQSPDGVVVFVEVRQRSTASHGGASASVSAAKQRRIVLAARHYLLRLAQLPACRFDVVSVEGPPDAPTLQWIAGAFTAEGY